MVVVDPPGPVLVFRPDVQVSVAFDPPLAAGDGVTATLRHEDGSVIDLTSALQFAPDGASGSVAVLAPPGLNVLDLERSPVAQGQNKRAILAIDRGGFFPGVNLPFESGVASFPIEFAAAGGGLRLLDLFVWYPTDEQGTEDVLLGGIVDASVAQGVSQLPTLLMSHGACGTPYYGTYLASELARRGWVVAAMSHPPSDQTTPGCGTNANLVAAFLERTNDLAKSLDWLVAQSADPQSTFYSLVDPQRVGVTGHSFGGQTAILAAASDARLKASLAMAPAYSAVGSIIDAVLPLGIPTMVMGGTNDFSTPFLVDQVPLYDKLASPRFLVEVVNGGHLNFQDICDFGTFCGQVDQPTGHGIILPYALGFLGHYVAGDPRWQSLIAEGAGSVLIRDD